MPRGILSRRSDTGQISWGKLSRLPRTVAESTLCIFDGYGLHGTLPARPTLAPCIRFLSIDSRVCSMLPSDTPRGGSPCTLLALHLHQVGQKTFTSKLLSMPSTQRTRFRGRGHPERTGSCHLWPSRRTAAVRCSPACSMLGDSGRQCRSQRGANSAKSHGFQGLIGGSCAFSVPCFHGGLRLNCDDDAPGRGPMRFKCEVTSRHVQPWTAALWAQLVRRTDLPSNCSMAGLKRSDSPPNHRNVATDQRA